MADLVKNIETWSLNQTDAKLLELVKRQLKDPCIDKNKLRKSASKDCEMKIAPIHAAALSNCPELFKLVLETDGVHPDPEFMCEGIAVGGVLDLAVKGANFDIVSMALEKIDKLHIEGITSDGKIVPACLGKAVDKDRLDIVELLLSKSAEYPVLNPFDGLRLSIKLNKSKIFSHLLPKCMDQINDPIGDKKITLLLLAVVNNKVKMLKQLVNAGSDVNLADVDGYTPLMVAMLITATGTCGEGCYHTIVSELLSYQNVDLDLLVEHGREKIKAIGLMNEKTCPHVRKVVDQAYIRDGFRKKLEKRKEKKFKESTTKTTKQKSEKEEVSKDKICWKCSADPNLVSLSRCKGCRKAWYCGEECQEVDWPRHGPWCLKKSRRREEREEEQKESLNEEQERKLSDVFYDLD